MTYFGNNAKYGGKNVLFIEIHIKVQFFKLKILGFKL